MTVTYTSAAERDTRRDRQRARAGSASPTSCCGPRPASRCSPSVWPTPDAFAVFDASEAQHAGVAAVNLNTVSDAAAIEPALTAIFAERRRPAVRRARVVPVRGDRPARRPRRSPMSAPSPARPSGSTRSSGTPRLDVFGAAGAGGPRGGNGERRPACRHDAAVHRLRSRRGETVLRRAHARRVPAVS